MTGTTVFVLDDDYAVRDSLRLLFEAMDWSAEFYSTVDEFLSHHDGASAGCLVLDISLPGNGMHLLEKLRANGSTLPVVVVTGHGDAATKRRADQLGVLGFFEKPFDPRHLCDAIGRAFSADAI